eukprot:gene12044-30324_t
MPLFVNETFAINAVDPGGKKFERVSRFVATTTPSKDGSFFELLLDVNVTLFPLTVGEDVTMVLAPSLAAGGGDGNGEELAEDYDYVMHGKC